MEQYRDKNYSWQGVQFDNDISSCHARESGYPESRILPKTLDSRRRGNDETGVFLSFCEAIQFNLFPFF
jgi:hypothetical protein